MRYITDIHALNLPCSLGTTGDWHHSSIQWQQPRMLDSDTSPFGEWGIEVDRTIICAGQKLEHRNVANHVRACLDMIEQGRLTCARGMRRDFLDDDESYDTDVFEHIALLRRRPNWPDIDSLMKKEHGMAWVDWKEKHGDPLARKA